MVVVEAGLRCLCANKSGGGRRGGIYPRPDEAMV
jgi:hypothetical protein